VSPIESPENRRSPIDHALDLALFGPLGLALSARDALPVWVDTGRRRVSHDIEVARMVGEQAARVGRRMATDTLVGLGVLPGRPPPRPRGAPNPGPSAGARRSPADGTPGAAENGVSNRAAPSSNGRTGSGATLDRAAIDRATPDGSAELAIPGYDSLSASQVVQRLAGLAAAELEAVRTYEASGRGRRTILTRISQLQTGRS
jgi:hypothetical protein